MFASIISQPTSISAKGIDFNLSHDDITLIREGSEFLCGKSFFEINFLHGGQLSIIDGTECEIKTCNIHVISNSMFDIPMNEFYFKIETNLGIIETCVLSHLFLNNNLNFDLEKISSYDEVDIEMDYDKNLVDKYIIRVNDNSYFYRERVDRNSDFDKLRKMFVGKMS